MLFHLQLRDATRPLHDAVDAAFGKFDLASPGSYARMLQAHVRALAPAEAALAGEAALPAWSPRLPLLLGDLEALGVRPAPPLAFAPGAGTAWRFGLLYVLEGSRLGGTLLARSVGAGLPRAYLGASHRAGEWRGFLAALDLAADTGGAAWREEAVAGARAGFALFEAAAA